MSLLSRGVPYDALQRAPEERILRWYAVLSEETDADSDRVNRMLEQYGS